MKDFKPTVLEGDTADEVAAAFAPEAIQDIDPASYLAEDDSDLVGFVNVKTKTGIRRLAIAALTEKEIGMAQKQATSPDKTRRGATVFDGVVFKRALVAMSLSKVTKTVVMPDHLGQKLSGSITIIADAITKLSGFADEKESESDRAVGFTG